MKLRLPHACLTAFSLFVGCGSVFAAEDAKPAAAPVASDKPAASQGLIPVPDYSGDLMTRNRITGDWGGTRTELANKGVQFDVTFTQVLQSVVDGGLNSTTRYSGSLDYVLTLDLMRMGVMPGAMVKFRGESRFGNSVNDDSGSILPVNTDAFFPLTSPLEEDIAITITNLTYYQFLSEQFGVVVGKIDTLDADPNEFASGRGVNQFMNANLVIPSSPLIVLPAYSTLAAGILWMPVKGVTVTSVALNAADSSTNTGFEDFGEGTAWMTEGQFQYRLGNLPGGFNVGFIYGFDNTFLDLNGRFTFQPGQGIVAPTTDDSWAFYASAWQYLCVEQQGDALINLMDGKQDLQGVGLFLRVGFADDDTSPIDVAISGGVGAKGIIPSRDNDTCGIAYYYNSIETGRIAGIVGIQDHTQGFEAFYNLHITPATQLTFDVQVIDSAQASIDTAVVLALRLNLQF